MVIKQANLERILVQLPTNFHFDRNAKHMFINGRGKKHLEVMDTSIL